MLYVLNEQDYGVFAVLQGDDGINVEALMKEFRRGPGRKLAARTAKVRFVRWLVENHGFKVTSWEEITV